MLYLIAGVLVVAIVLLRSTAPKRYSVHASRAIPLPEGRAPYSRYPFAGFVRDENGNRLTMADKFVGQAVRDSMAACGIPDGATFFADRLDDAEKARMQHGDIVVVDGDAGNSEVGYRLRRIERIDGTEAYFSADGLGAARRHRPISELLAKVSHVTVAEAPSGGLVNFIGRLLPSHKAAA